MKVSKVRIHVLIPEELLHRIDSFAGANGMSLSGFLAFSAKQYLDVASPTPDMKK